MIKSVKEQARSLKKRRFLLQRFKKQLANPMGVSSHTQT
eukprot:UN12138